MIVYLPHLTLLALTLYSLLLCAYKIIAAMEYSDEAWARYTHDYR